MAIMHILLLLGARQNLRCPSVNECPKLKASIATSNANEFRVMLVDVTAQPNASAGLVGEASNPSLHLVKIRLERRQAGTLGTTRVEAQLPPVRGTGRRTLAGLPLATDSLSISNYVFGLCVLCVWGVAPPPSNSPNPPHIDFVVGAFVVSPARGARPQKPPHPHHAVVCVWGLLWTRARASTKH